MSAQEQNAWAMMSQAAAGLQAAASGGGFTVDPQGGQYLVAALQNMLTEVESAIFNAQNLAVAPPLGSSPGANTYKPFLASIAGDPHQGAIAVWTQLKTDLTIAINTINQAMQNYQQTDQANAESLRGPNHAS